MSPFLFICVLTAITFFNRYLFLIRGLPLSPGSEFKRLLRYSPYAVLTAIWAPLVFHFNIQSAAVSSSGWHYMIAATLAVILTILRVSTLLVVLLSSAVFFVLRYYFF